MRIKQHFLPCILCAIVLLCFVFLSSAFAELEKVEEDELARTNASVSGTPVETTVDISTDKESLLKTADTTIDKTGSDLSASMLIPKTAMEGTLHIQSLNNQEATRTYVGGAYGTYTGGITTVTPR